MPLSGAPLEVPPVAEEKIIEPPRMEFPMNMPVVDDSVSQNKIPEKEIFNKPMDMPREMKPKKETSEEKKPEMQSEKAKVIVLNQKRKRVNIEPEGFVSKKTYIG